MPELHRSLWLEQALADESEGDPCPPLSGSSRADVCILGGGYTGLWTALFLKEREPGLDVVVLERDICGGGASGRNGGFVLSWWAKLAALVQLCGEADGLWLAREAEAAVGYVGEFCREHGLGDEFRHAGWLWAATSTAQLDSWQPTVAETERRGIGVFERLSPEAVQRRGGSNAYLAGVLDRTAAIVHPARLVRAMRRAALAAGVRIYEGTSVVDIEDGAHPVAIATTGRVEADTVVAALNAWTVEVPAFRRLSRTMIIVSSDMVATAPAPDVLEFVGWTGGEAITDSRLMVHYHRTTLDGRVAIGRGGGAIGRATRVGDRFDYSPARCDDVAHGLHRFYPELARVPVSHGWGGPIDRSLTGLPFFGRLPGSGNVVYGLGFTGNGVGPCVVGARILASLALREESRWSTNGLTRPPAQLFPPEPICSLGGRIVRRAVARKESIEDAGGEPGRIVRSVAGLAPAGLFKVSDVPPE